LYQTVILQKTKKYTEYPILNNTLRFLKNCDRYGKMFQTKVV